VLVRAARAGVGCEREGPLPQRVEECAEGLLEALREEGYDRDVDELQDLIGALE
jgi:hypothetical protein